MRAARFSGGWVRVRGLRPGLVGRGGRVSRFFLFGQFLAAEDGGVGDNLAAGLCHLARITGCDRIAGGVAGGGSAGIGGCGGVIAVLAAAPLHGSQGQGLAVVRGGLGNKGQVGIGQVGISTGGGQALGAGLVTLGLHGDGGIVQRQQAGIAVLGRDLPMGVQLFQDHREIVGVAVLGDGVGVVLGVHPHLVLSYHVQQEIAPPVALEVLRRDAGGVVGQRKLVHFVDAQLVKAAVGVFLHGDGIERPASGQRRGCGDADCQNSGT